MHIGLAADHGGFELKAQLTAALKAAGYEVADFGAHEAQREIWKDEPHKYKDANDTAGHAFHRGLGRTSAHDA